MFFFYDILKGNKRFSTKTNRSNSRKIEIFLKGLVHGFGQKLAIFPTFFSRQYCPPFVLPFLIYAAPRPTPPPPLLLLATDERKRFQNLKIVLNNKNEKSEDYSEAD